MKTQKQKTKNNNIGFFKEIEKSAYAKLSFIDKIDYVNAILKYVEKGLNQTKTNLLKIKETKMLTKHMKSKITTVSVQTKPIPKAISFQINN